MEKRKRNRINLAGRFLKACLLSAALLFAMPLTAGAAEKENIVVVIDPGHGGTNMGGQFAGLNEKELTLVTALSMKEELEKYEGVTVYLTRNGDAELSLKERAQIAANLGADFFFCLHFNKSVSQELYGAEVWIPSFGDGYVKGYAAGDLVLNELCDNTGLFRRGIKTKVGNSGADYYGILRESGLLGIPTILVEHCHMDNVADVPFYNSIEQLQKLGRLDATAAAKYFQLKSQSLGVDYTGYAKTQVAAPAVPVLQDVTPPDITSISLKSKDDKQAQIAVTAQDYQSGILYYQYSSDAGATWSALIPWNRAGNTMEITVPLSPSAANKSVLVRTLNGYDYAATSNAIAY